MTLICINTYADYAGGVRGERVGEPSSVYQPKSKEAIFNSLEKHTLQEDFECRAYITVAPFNECSVCRGGSYGKVADNRWKKGLGWKSVLLQ